MKSEIQRQRSEAAVLYTSIAKRNPTTYSFSCAIALKLIIAWYNHR